jgi:hypothetical protein
MSSPLASSSLRQVSGTRFESKLTPRSDAWKSESPRRVPLSLRAYAGRILKLANSPPDVLPTQMPTRPFFRSLSWSTVRHGSFESAR